VSGLDPQDATLVTLARAARLRSVVVTIPAEGAAVRDETGRTYSAASVERGDLRLSALRLAVAMALSSGARRFEAAAVTGGAAEPDRALLGDDVPVLPAGPDGTVRDAVPT
jgi:cytidine deaminase